MDTFSEHNFKCPCLVYRLKMVPVFILLWPYSKEIGKSFYMVVIQNNKNMNMKLFFPKDYGMATQNVINRAVLDE